MELDLDLDLDPDLPLCKRCYMFYSALDVLFTNDPPLRFLYFKNFNEKGRRILIFKSHSIPSEQKVQWITTMLQCYTGILPPGVGVFKARFARPPWADGPDIKSPDIKSPSIELTEEHILFHIVRYSMLIPHSDSARYRPSSHVVPARCNPFRFVKSAR